MFPKVLLSVAAGDVVIETATLQNNRTSAVNVGTIGPGSVSGAAYAFESTTCGSTLAAGASCAISVRMATTSQGGPYTGSLTVNAAGQKTNTFSGTRSAANLQLALADADVGAVEFGTYVDMPVTITNTGNANITSLQFINPGSGWTTYRSNNCANPLKPGQSCQAVFRVQPAGWGTGVSDRPGVRANSVRLVQGWLFAHSNAQGVVVSPSLVDFGTVAASTWPYPSRMVTVTNNTGSPITVSNISSMGAINRMFGGTCPFNGTISPGASCTVEVALNTYSGTGKHRGSAYLQTNLGMIFMPGVGTLQ